MTRPGRLEWWQDPPDGIDEARADYFDRMAELRAERERLRATCQSCGLTPTDCGARRCCQNCTHQETP